MKASNIGQLLTQLAALQTDGETDNAFGPEEMAASIRGEREITPEERAALWRSPHLREEFLTIRRAVIDQTRADWFRQGFGTSVLLRAAAAEVGLTVVQGQGWFVEIVRLAPSAWAISLTVASEAKARLPALAEIQILDDGELVWGRGALADDGTLDLEWPHHVSPLDRLMSHGLSIAPV